MKILVPTYQRVSRSRQSTGFCRLVVTIIAAASSQSCGGNVGVVGSRSHAPACATPDYPAPASDTDELPRAESALLLDLPSAQEWVGVPVVVAVELMADGGIFVDGAEVGTAGAQDETILEKLRAALNKEPDLRAIIRADLDVPHGRVIHVMDLVKQAGIAKLAFAVKPDGTGADSAPVVVPKKSLATVKGGSFQCPFPVAADLEEIREASVRLVVAVDANGAARWVRVLEDPGFGFGQAATQCALT